MMKKKKKLCFLKRLFLGVQFPYYCRLEEDSNADFRGARWQTREGDALQIVHLPTKDDCLAVFVYSVSLNRVLGRLTKYSAQKMIKAFGKGFCTDGEIYVWLEKGDDCRIELLIFNSRSFMDGNDFSFLHE